MRLDWLEDILAVAEAGSLTAAAERRGLTQPAFSRRLRLIEDQLGVALFDRSRKPIALLPSAQGQIERIAATTQELRDLGRALREGAEASQRRIVIVCQHALTAAFTPTVVEDLRSRAPELFVRLASANLSDCFARLLAREADIAIVYRQRGEAHPVRPDFIETAVVGAERLVPVIGAAHHARIVAGLEEGQLPYVAYPAEVFLGQVQARQFMEPTVERLRPVAQAETALTLAAAEMAQAGLGVAWVPASLVRRQIDEGRLAELSDRLPATALDVTAVRLRGEAAPALGLAWSRIVERGGAATPPPSTY